MPELTLDEFRRRGGFVAFVPGDTSHLYTAPKSIRETAPDGSTTTRIGPEVLMTEMVEGRRVVRFRDISDFCALKNGRHGLDWERANPELCQQLAELGRSNRQPGAIWG